MWGSFFNAIFQIYFYIASIVSPSLESFFGAVGGGVIFFKPSNFYAFNVFVAKPVTSSFDSLEAIITYTIPSFK